MAKRIGLVLLLVVCLSACGPSARRRVRIRVGSADSPQQIVLGIITLRTLRTAGYRTIDRTGLGTPSQVRAALEAGDIDVCWEYTGDTWLIHLEHDRPIFEPAELYAKVREDDRRNQIEWVAMAPVERTLGLVMRSEAARDGNIVTLSGLSRHMSQVDPSLSLCTPKEIHQALHGIRGMERYYGLHFDETAIRWYSIGDGYQALARGDCDCAVGYTTDGEITGKGLCLLEDDENFFLASNLAVAVRAPVLQELPGLEEVLRGISERFTQEAVTEMNRQLMIVGQDPAEVAKSFTTKMR